ncbi:MAG: hypothetical protein ACI9MJ_002652 [Alphaproteobacteria bacterium]|jgi:hypothetical protein
MSLPPATERELIQTRSVEVSSYRRADGRWEVEGRLVDTAAFAIPNKFRGEIEAGEPIHDMNLRLTLDENVEITEIHAAMDSTPYAMCPAIESAFQKLKGVRIGPGWNRKIREILGGAQGCIHMVDLLRPIGTVGFKTVKREAGKLDQQAAARNDDSPYQINTCHTMASDGPVAKERWPHLYTGT